MPSKKPASPKPSDPDELGPGGRALWDSVIEVEPDMPEYRRVDLHEACRIKDRLNKINAGLNDRMDESYLTEAYKEDGTVIEVTIKQAVSVAANLAEKGQKLVATLRLPGAKVDPRGSKPGVSRGSYAKSEKKETAAEMRARMRSVS